MTRQGISSSSWCILMLVVCCWLNLCFAESGWSMNDGNMWRSRFVRDGVGKLGVYQNAHVGWRILSRSLVMDSETKHLYGMATNLSNGKDFLVNIANSTGLLIPIAEFPVDSEWVSGIPPLYQQEGNYYFTVRRDKLSRKDFILRSSVISGAHFSFTDRDIYRPIIAMVLVKSPGRNGLALVHNSVVQCFDTSTGALVWSNFRDGLLDSVKMFVEEDNLLVFGKELGYQFSVSNGGLMGTAPNSFSTGGRQEFFALSYMGQNTIVSTIQKSTEGYSIVNYNARRLYDFPGKTTILLKDQFNVPIDLENCSNIISTANTFNFMCKARNSPPFVYGYALKSGITFVKTYEINLNYVTGMNTRTCSNQIALVEEDRFAVVCDIGMVLFRTGDNNVSHRVEFRIPINTETQVFGTDGNLSLVSFDDSKSYSQSLKTK